MNNHIPPVLPLVAHFLKYISSATLFLVLMVTSIVAQTVTSYSPTNGTTPMGLAPGAPAGSYPLSGFDSLNPYSANLSFHLPLLQIGGRGNAGYTMTLPIERKWRINKTVTDTRLGCQSCEEQFVTYKISANSDWWNSGVPDFGPGLMTGRYSGYNLHSGCFEDTQSWQKGLTRLTFTTSDGTEYEFRDKDHNGEPRDVESCIQGASRGTIFITADGTSATFISDTVIHDATVPMPEDAYFTVSGYLLLRDGTRYRIDEGRVSWIRDRNGNMVRFPAGTGKIIDSLNREVTVGVGSIPDSREINFKGFNGAPRKIRIIYGWHANALRPASAQHPAETIKSPAELFPEITDWGENNIAGYEFHTKVVTSVELPDGRSYHFFYNSYGELARVELPTGGAFEYDWSGGVLNMGGAFDTGPNYEVYRQVDEKRVYKEDGILESRTVIGACSDAVPNGNSCRQVDQVDPNNNNTLLQRTKHFYYGVPGPKLFKEEIHYPQWNEGKEYKTEVTGSDGVTVLKRIETNWAQRETVPWWAPYSLLLGPEPANDPRVLDVTTSLTDVSPSLVSKQIFGYDDRVPFNNQNNVKEYDFGNGAPGALMRETRTTYIISGGYIDAIGVHLRSLASQISVYDGGGTKRAQTTYEFDNYNQGPFDVFHAALKNEADISGLRSRTNVSPSQGYIATADYNRGNITKSTRDLLDGTGEVTASIARYLQYDIAGNVVAAIDPRSAQTNIIATTFDFSDRFGAPDGDAQANTTPTELNNVQQQNNVQQHSYAFPTLVTNALGQTGYTQFDYYLGKAVDMEDANGVVSSVSYDDPLDRPKQIIRAANKGILVKSQTSFSYADAIRTITITSDLNSFNDPNPLKTESVYDGLGRNVQARQYETSAAYITVKTNYDAQGRPFQTSNPYRAGETVRWTTSTFDALGRLVLVKTPDNAVVSTAYSGNQVLVTDQAGKRRLSLTNALGQLKDIWEITDADESTEGVSFQSQPIAGYRTKYSYDALGNLTTVTQQKGSTGTIQTRSFVFNSLSQLTDATNPENGHVVFDYDPSGNVLHKTDARLVTTTFGYDALNRNKTVDYSDTTAVNPDVTRAYDGAENGIGLLWQSYAGGNETSGPNVEHTKIQSYDEMGRPRVRQQRFKLNGVWNPNVYETKREYNLAGRVTLQTYPSGHIVNYNYDRAGRLADKDAQNLAFTGNLGDNVMRTYLRGVTYSPFGSMAQEQFGTDTAIYNKLVYNYRGQLAEIKESSTPNDDSWNRGKFINWYSLQCGGVSCNVTDNNGNLRKQETFIPNNEQNTSSTSWYQQYEYDKLNRLTQVHEHSGNTSLLWQQSYAYDRYGNRSINQSGTTQGVGINTMQAAVVPNTITNRLYGPGETEQNHPLIDYDNAGNQTKDYYSVSGVNYDRSYDGENRMISSTATYPAPAATQSSYYTYNAEGQRVRRKINGVETWQVYGMDGELVAEYAANAAFTAPQKEYGYRNGQLLITADSALAGRTNVALSANGGVATASSTYSSGNSGANTTNNGDRKGNSTSGSWNDAAPANTFPDWLQIDFSGSKTIDEIDVFTVQDNWQNPSEPTETMTFSLYGLTGYDVQYWTGSTWVTATGGGITSNNKVWKKLTFSAITTTKIRVLTHASPDGYSRITELEAWTSSTSPPTTTNVALASNGASASASSAYAGLAASGGQDGDRKGLNYLQNTTWSGAAATFPQWLQIDFNGTKTIGEIDVFTLQDNYQNPSEPTETMTFSLHGLSGYDVQYWNGSSWVTVPGGSVINNNKVWRKFTFSAISTSKIRVATNASVNGWSELTEVEAWAASEGSGGTTANINWLVTDQLGTPRMIFDKSGSLANVKRHDYLPFGEELGAGQGLRTPPQGYVADGVRQKLTSKERDNETGLDYFGARYYSSLNGRLTSVDPMPVTAENFVNPQRWNQYSYVLNNPLASVDPSGGDGEGKGGDKVISVFLHIDADQSRDKVADKRTKVLIGNAPGPWQKVKREAGSNYKIELYGSAEMTGEAGSPSAKSYYYDQTLNSSEVSVYVGHGNGPGAGTDESPFSQEGILMDSMYYQSQGKELINPDGRRSGLFLDKPVVSARVVASFSCDSSRPGGSYFNFTGNGQVMVTINSGKDGVTNAPTLEKAAAAFVRVYVKTGGDYVRAAAAANKVIQDNANREKNKGDAVVIKVVN